MSVLLTLKSALIAQISILSDVNYRSLSNFIGLFTLCLMVQASTPQGLMNCQERKEDSTSTCTQVYLSYLLFLVLAEYCALLYYLDIHSMRSTVCNSILRAMCCCVSSFPSLFLSLSLLSLLLFMMFLL